MLVLVTIPIFCSRLTGHGIGGVLRSEHDGVKNGDYVYGIFRAHTFNYLLGIHLVVCAEHQQYNICPNLKYTQVIDNQYNLPLSAFIGPAGMPGRCLINHQDFFFKCLIQEKLHIWPGRNTHVQRRWVIVGMVDSCARIIIVQGETVFVTTGGGIFSSFKLFHRS